MLRGADHNSHLLDHLGHLLVRGLVPLLGPRAGDPVQADTEDAVHVPTVLQRFVQEAEVGAPFGRLQPPTLGPPEQLVDAVVFVPLLPDLPRSAGQTNPFIVSLITWQLRYIHKKALN